MLLRLTSSDYHVMYACLLLRGCRESFFPGMLLSPLTACYQVMCIEEYLHAWLPCSISLLLRNQEVMALFHSAVLIDFVPTTTGTNKLCPTFRS